MPRGKPRNLIGETFGRLRVLDLMDDPRRGRWWNCQCTCGQTKVVRGDNLTSERTESCGCLLTDIREGRVEGITIGRPRKYGTNDGPVQSRRHVEYSAWQRMIARCENGSHPEFASNGGAGIRVDKSWRESFETFYADLGARPSKDYVIVRRDRQQHYCKANVYWGTRAELTTRRAPQQPKKIANPDAVNLLEF